MAGTNKRASMREGPLAALFRKTGEPDADAPPPETPPHPRDTGYPHPGLSATEPATEAARVPSPQDRLRHAFSSELEIPDDILDPIEARRVEPAAAADPIDDVYARTDAPTRRRRPAAEDQREPGRRGADRRPEDPYARAAADVYARSDQDARVPPARVVGQPVLRVVGVGGAGVNAVNRMVEAEVAGVEFVAINTDLQSLQQSTADVTLHIGAQITRGLGSGANTDLGRASAMEEYDKIKALLKGSDMIFIAAGAGGGTGTGAAPVVARIAREIGALTVGIVTKPFGFEGTRRAEQADKGVQALAEEVDTLIVVPNNRLLAVLDKQTSMVDAFRVADDVLRQGVQGVSDLVTLPGLINLDFADVRTVMCDAGNALLGIGMGTGENRATEAAMAAVSSPLLETSMDGARSILLSITGGKDLSLWEVNEAAKAVSEAAHVDANIIFGAMVDEKLEDQVWVTVVATGFDGQRSAATRSRLREPAGEPRVERRRVEVPVGHARRADGRADGRPGEGRVDGRRDGRGTTPRYDETPPSRPRRPALSGADLDVPEFMPR
jgi:cell division protein FtsZ